MCDTAQTVIKRTDNMRIIGSRIARFTRALISDAPIHDAAPGCGGAPPWPAPETAQTSPAARHQPETPPPRRPESRAQSKAAHKSGKPIIVDISEISNHGGDNVKFVQQQLKDHGIVDEQEDVTDPDTGKSIGRVSCSGSVESQVSRGRALL
jgi:hypothetical protein